MPPEDADLGNEKTVENVCGESDTAEYVSTDVHWTMVLEAFGNLFNAKDDSLDDANASLIEKLAREHDDVSRFRAALRLLPVVREIVSACRSHQTLRTITLTASLRQQPDVPPGLADDLISGIMPLLQVSHWNILMYEIMDRGRIRFSGPATVTPHT